MKLKKLVKNVPLDIKGSKEIVIKGITQDSKTVKPGDLFVARKGKVFDGTHFIPEAITAGAVCILTDIYNPFYSVSQLISKDVSNTAIELAQIYYDFPYKNLQMVGVTGTSGKTTVSFLVQHVLGTCGRIGTNGYSVCNNLIDAPRTTPDALVILKLLKEMKDKQLKNCVMEVTSHALDQNRVGFIDYDIAIFTNLSQDHLDYHGNMEEYFQAKKKLFSLLDKSSKKNKCAIVNLDDLHSSKITEGLTCDVITYSIHKKADIYAEQIELSLQKTQMLVCYKEQKCLFTTSLIGSFNASNLLAAIAVGIRQGMSLFQLQETFKDFTFVEGRLEKVCEYKNAHVFIDYAHKPEALQKVLQILRKTAKGKLYTVFGCGGNRDKSKRGIMGKIAEEYSDHCYLTNDNPRGEDPLKIIEQISLGFMKSDSFSIITDRKKAIETALKNASKEDIVLIAGKGHEKVQIFTHKTLPFDDKEAVMEFI